MEKLGVNISIHTVSKLGKLPSMTHELMDNGNKMETYGCHFQQTWCKTNTVMQLQLALYCPFVINLKLL